MRGRRRKDTFLLHKYVLSVTDFCVICAFLCNFGRFNHSGSQTVVQNETTREDMRLNSLAELPTTHMTSDTLQGSPTGHCFS